MKGYRETREKEWNIKTKVRERVKKRDRKNERERKREVKEEKVWELHSKNKNIRECWKDTYSERGERERENKNI